MKFLPTFGAFLLLSLSLHGQSPPDVDLEQYRDWEADALYAEAKKGLSDLENPPQIRLQYVEIALARAKEEGNFQWAAEFATSGAVVYSELGMNQQALQSALEAREYAKQTPSRADDIWLLYRLSGIRATLKDKEQALQDAHLALQIALARDTLQEVGWSYNMLGEAHRNFEQYDSAVYHYQKGLTTFQKIDYKRGIRFCNQNLGLTYVAMRQFDKATQAFALAGATEAESDILYRLEQGAAMMEIIAAQHALDSAIAFGRDMMTQAERENYPIWEKTYKAKLADFHRRKADWATAWKYHMEADSLSEIQTGERIRLQSSITDHQYRMQLLNAAHELQTQENRNKILLWMSILVVLGLLGVFAMVQITKNKRIRKINARLSQQNDHLDELIKEKDIWMNLMAHDLKSPLNAIDGLLGLLQKPDLPTEMREKVILNISRSVNKGSELISQLLEISRLETGEIKAEIKDTDLRTLVLDTKNIFEPIAEKKSIDLQAEVPSEAVTLATDPVLALRILENLLSNAIKFSPREKQVRLVLESLQDRVQIHVIDQGPGMTADDRQNLFRKFRKLSARPTGGESSTGLGLSIVKQLADRIHADILVASEPGAGATFTLSMPKS